jgi:hypothetical protein
MVRIRFPPAPSQERTGERAAIGERGTRRTRRWRPDHRRRSDRPTPEERGPSRRAIYVDQAGGTGEAKIHRRHQALPAGKDLSLLAVHGKEIERIVNGAGRKISKRDGFHRDEQRPSNTYCSR